MKEILIYIEERAITKYNGMMRNFRGQIYRNPKVSAFEASCREYAKYNGPVLQGKLRVDIDFFFDNNKMPDLFNLPKAVCDAFNGVIWKDDRQIVEGHLRKINFGKPSRIFLRIQELPEN